MQLDSDTYEYIIGEIVNMLIKCNVTEYPIDVYDIAKKLGIILKPYLPFGRENEKLSKMSDDGFAVIVADKEYIYYDDTVQESRKRWTIMHEIAHLLLGHKINCLMPIQDEKYLKETEKEANYYAKYALAPLPLIYSINPSCAKDIENKFKLSHEASLYVYNLYLKWLRRHLKIGKYSDYERNILCQVRNVA